jgi:hypothetical protein
MVLATALLALMTGCRAAPPMEPETHWGTAQNGLQAGIQPSTDETVPGEAVEFTFYLRNGSANPTTVARPGSGTLVWHFDGHAIRSRPGRPDQTVVLEPNDSAQHVVRHAWVTPGTYTVYAELQPKAEGAAASNLQSGQTTITVTE